MTRLGVRAQVRHAVAGMKAAEATEDPIARLRLARPAALELVAAHGLAHGASETGPEPIAESLSRVLALPKAARHGQAIAQLRDSAASVAVAKLQYDELARLFAWLEGTIDTRTPREIWLARWSLRAAAAAALLFGVWWAATPRNLARDREVSASSTCGLMPPPELGKTRLSRAVDGTKNELRSFAVCTELEQHPWLMVDLGAPHRLDHAVVYPRADCCYGEDELPLSVQVSTDNQHFESIDEVSSPAIGEFPWRFALHGREARYVRWTSRAAARRHIVVSELEVYGR